MYNEIIYIDGACNGINGEDPEFIRGGASVVRVKGDYSEVTSKKSLSVRDPRVTNNRMEMIGLIEALCSIHINDEYKGSALIKSDSQLLVKGYNEWLDGWSTNGWVKSNGQDVANRDLWEYILFFKNSMATKGIKVDVDWVKGHQKIDEKSSWDAIYNDKADVEAFKASTEISKLDNEGTYEKYLKFIEEVVKAG